MTPALGTRDDFVAFVEPNLKFSLRNLGVLCASAVKEPQKQVNRRGAEDAEITQRE